MYIVCARQERGGQYNETLGNSAEKEQKGGKCKLNRRTSIQTYMISLLNRQNKIHPNPLHQKKKVVSIRLNTSGANYILKYLKMGF